MPFISQDKVFYGASAFLGILAIIYFGFEYLIALSPFTISVILFSAFATFLGIGLNRKGNGSVLAYIFSAASFGVALFYTIGKLGLGSDGIMISLIMSSALFAALGYLITQKKYAPNKKQLKTTAIILAMLVGGLIIYDVASGNISYEYSLNEQTEVSENIGVGEVTTFKNSALPYDSDGVTFRGCLYNETGERQRTSLYFQSDANTMKFGEFENTQKIEFDLDMDRVDIEGTVPIEELEAESCPENTDESKLILFTEMEPITYVAR